MNDRVLEVSWGRATVSPEDAQRRLREAFDLILRVRLPKSALDTDQMF